MVNTTPKAPGAKTRKSPLTINVTEQERLTMAKIAAALGVEITQAQLAYSAFKRGLESIVKDSELLHGKL